MVEHTITIYNKCTVPNTEHTVTEDPHAHKETIEPMGFSNIAFVSKTGPTDFIWLSYQIVFVGLNSWDTTKFLNRIQVG